MNAHPPIPRALDLEATEPTGPNLDRIYITTTIPYVNAPPHVGFALELVQADALARFHRQTGARVRLQTGTDENAFKNVVSAKEQGIPVRELVDRNAARFGALVDALGISADVFLRTATPEHTRAVEAFLARLRPDDLYTSAYRGLYCPGCEDFFLEKDLEADGGCADHGQVIAPIEEENVFFRLSRYQSEIAERIRSGRLKVTPESRRTEVLSFIERGLQDISISRDAARSGGWGIPFPGLRSQVVYVWIDALVNYLTGLGFGAEEQLLSCFWADGSRRIHLIGKNVWKFHAVYWPALLLSAGLPLPDEIVVHGFLTANGRKISKSEGNAVDPVTYVERYGPDALRYFLLRHVRPFEDSDFTEERLAAVYNADLANGLGNLTSRLTTLCERFGVGAGELTASVGVARHIADYRFDRGLDELWKEVDALNREIAEARPWDSDDSAESFAATRAQLAGWAVRLRGFAVGLRPFLPETAARLEEALGAPAIKKAAPLFPRRE